MVVPRPGAALEGATRVGLRVLTGECRQENPLETGPAWVLGDWGPRGTCSLGTGRGQGQFRAAGGRGGRMWLSLVPGPSLISEGQAGGGLVG